MFLCTHIKLIRQGSSVALDMPDALSPQFNVFVFLGLKLSTQ